MKRRVFFSFHYNNDNWRVQQIRNMGQVEGNSLVSSNAWEEVKRKGDDSIKRWINSAMEYRSCVVVLAGRYTANRKWINYEIEHAWKEGKGIVVVYIHGLKNISGEQDYQGENPLKYFCIDKTFNYIAHHENPADGNEINLSLVCSAYNPPYSYSNNVYQYIYDNLSNWCDEAVAIRNSYPK
jgi:hypothetical protein